MPDVEAADAAGEVDERVAVDVRQCRAASLGGDDRMDERQWRGDDALLALENLLRAGPGELGPDLDRLGDRHEREDSAVTGSLHR